MAINEPAEEGSTRLTTTGCSTGSGTPSVPAAATSSVKERMTLATTPAPTTRARSRSGRFSSRSGPSSTCSAGSSGSSGSSSLRSSSCVRFSSRGKLT